MSMNLQHVQELAKRDPGQLASLIQKLPLDRKIRKQIETIVLQQFIITVRTNSKIDAVSQMYLYSLYKLSLTLRDADAIKRADHLVGQMVELEGRDGEMRVKAFDAIQQLLAHGIDEVVQSKEE